MKVDGKRTRIPGRPLTRGRGLKRPLTISITDLPGRPLTRGRGLKLETGLALVELSESPPHTGARIETLLDEREPRVRLVAPSHGGAD